MITDPLRFAVDRACLALGLWLTVPPEWAGAILIVLWAVGPIVRQVWTVHAQESFVTGLRNGIQKSRAERQGGGNPSGTSR